ncbi:MAG TPA: hypothetical protein VFU46_05715 [Gemmatimonadales bacterium]|nr:hypothetical protein [Gemmatimonadales bacterium]
MIATARGLAALALGAALGPRLAAQQVAYDGALEVRTGRHLGYAPRMYHGSFIDWSRRPELAVAP